MSKERAPVFPQLDRLAATPWEGWNKDNRGAPGMSAAHRFGRFVRAPLDRIYTRDEGNPNVSDFSEVRSNADD